ncbi:hypothetical protein C6341_g3154 [Phytophthora cactorum]|nr:hypothetical protein C6341_g3154 [Phytophthora cactorum]
MLCGKSCARTKRFWWLCAPHYLVFTLYKLQLTETSNTCQSGKRTTECQCNAGPAKAAVVSESAQERAVFQARSVPAVMAVVNKKLSEAVAAGEGAKHNIEVEETEGQSDDDSDDTMTAGFWKTHIFKKRKRGNMDRDLRVKAVARAPNQPGCDTADELSDYSPSPPPVLKRGDQCVCSSARQILPALVLRVASARLAHNHALSKHTFNQYPHNRTALEPEMVTTVNELRNAGAKQERILKNIFDNSKCNPSNKDVYNLVRKQKKQKDTATTGAKRLKQWMIEVSEEPGNVGRNFVDSVKNTV